MCHVWREKSVESKRIGIDFHLRVHFHVSALRLKKFFVNVTAAIPSNFVHIGIKFRRPVPNFAKEFLTASAGT